MSEYWDVYCRTCGKQFGEFDARAQLGIKDANHRQDMICALIRLAPAFIAFNAALRVEPLAEIGVTYGYADRSLNLRWFEEHAGHERVARNEYGNCIDECADYFTCPACKHRKRCRREKEHAGEHSEERDPR